MIREYQLEVVTKREANNYYCILLGFHDTDFSVPYWLKTDLMGTPFEIKVTDQEYNIIKIGDICKFRMVI